MARYLDEVAARLVGFDTVSSKSNTAAVEYLAEHFDSHGFKVFVQRNQVRGCEKANLVAWTGPPVEGGLILCGHIDTVPFEGQPGWTCEPLRLDIGPERVSGRGTSDMKAFLAQTVAAASLLDQAKLSRPIVIVLTHDEEVGSHGAAALAPQLIEMLGEVPCPRQAWLGEPTSYRVFSAHKGVVVFKVEVKGIGGHSSRPDLGVNAITVAGRVIEEIGAWQRELLRRPSDELAVQLFADSPHHTVNLGRIRGGLAANLIAEVCEIEISLRILPMSDPLEPYREIRQRIEAIERSDYGGSGTLAEVEVGSPMLVAPLLSARGTELEKALFRVLSVNDCAGAMFATDGPQLARLGIESLICGPGALEQAHQPNESISRATYELGTDVILQVIREVCMDGSN